MAVLTGVLSRWGNPEDSFSIFVRFEEYCGVFRPDIRRHYRKPVKSFFTVLYYFRFHFDVGFLENIYLRMLLQ